MGLHYSVQVAFFGIVDVQFWRLSAVTLQQKEYFVRSVHSGLVKPDCAAGTESGGRFLKRSSPDLARSLSKVKSELGPT